MQDKQRIEHLGYMVGKAGVEQVLEHSSLAMQREKVRIEKTNESAIVRCTLELSLLNQERNQLAESLPPTIVEENARAPWWGWNLWIIYLISAGANIAFLHIGLKPFNFGPLVWAVSIAGALVVPVALDRFLEQPALKKATGVICLLATVSGLAGTLVLASVRGDISMLEVRRALPADSEEDPLNQADGEDFYKQTGPKVTLFLIFLALGMEMAGALVFHEISQRSRRPNREAAKIMMRIAEIDERRQSLAAAIIDLRNQPAIVEAEFFRNVYLGMLDIIKSKGLLPLSLLALCLWIPAASAAPKHLTVVVLLDFTQSASSQGYDGKMSFDRNLDSAARLILALPPATQVHAVAISDQSFAKPWVLVSRQIAAGHGPLQYSDQIMLSKHRIVAALRKAARSRQPEFRQTDILGALRVASDFLGATLGQKLLVLFSDMQHNAAEIKLEKGLLLPVDLALQRIAQLQPVADLRDVTVYALGVDAVGISVASWDRLRKFWEEYFRASGAELVRFSVTRDPPNLGAD